MTFGCIKTGMDENNSRQHNIELYQYEPSNQASQLEQEKDL